MKQGTSVANPTFPLGSFVESQTGIWLGTTVDGRQREEIPGGVGPRAWTPPDTGYCRRQLLSHISQWAPGSLGAGWTGGQREAGFSSPLPAGWVGLWAAGLSLLYVVLSGAGG